MGFVLTIFVALIVYVHGATVSISTTSRGFTSTESGTPYFICYKSTPSLSATVTSGRYVFTANGMEDPANDPPPNSTALTVPGSNPPVQAYRTFLDTKQHMSFGAFYCAGAQDGQYTAVPTIFLRSNAQFIPTSGRFSKTVNKGDANVTVDFTEVTPSDDRKNWRFNGTTDPAEVLAGGSSIYGQLTVYIIEGEIETINGGVYELYLGGTRGQARAGLLRLIVRACPAGRYDVSRGCTRICPSCYNGGICHDETGICICPPGFQGDNCEIACGGNRHGRNCEYRCHYGTSDDRTACSGLQVCVPDPYGCSCTPGYKGLNCTTGCGKGEFGASCTEKCHCVSGECDRFNGVCIGSSSECEPEWTGKNCQKCQVGRYGPDCNLLSIRYDKANLGEQAQFDCNLEGGNFISKAEPAVNLYRKFGNEASNNREILRNGTGIGVRNSEYLYLVSNVRRGEIFTCVVSDVKTFKSLDLIADGEYTPPEISSPPVVNGTTNASVTLIWDAWDASTDIGDPPLDRYRVYYRLNDPEARYKEVVRTDRLGLSQTVTGLIPDTFYAFDVAAVRPGLGGEGRRLEVQGKTKCSPPSGVPFAVNASSSTRPGTINVKWQNPPYEANCRGGIRGVRISWESVGSSSIYQGSIDAPLNPSNGYDLTSLEPYTSYAITTAVLNQDAVGFRSEQSVAMTSEEEAPPPSVIQAISSTTFIIVKWNASTPPHLNGNLRGYTVNYRRVQPPSQEWQTEFIMTKQLMDIIYIIEEVQDGERYEIRINTVNGLGSGEWSTVTAIEIIDSERFSLQTLLLSSFVPAVVLFFVIVILTVVIICNRRTSDHGIPVERNRMDSYVITDGNTSRKQSQSVDNTYMDIYESVRDDGGDVYLEPITSAQLGDENDGKAYINVGKEPKGRKNVLDRNEIENA